MKALLLALLAVVVVHQALHRKPHRPSAAWIGYSGGCWTRDCVPEGLDARGRAHPNGGGV